MHRLVLVTGKVCALLPTTPPSIHHPPLPPSKPPSIHHLFLSPPLLLPAYRYIAPCTRPTVNYTAYPLWGGHLPPPLNPKNLERTPATCALGSQLKVRGSRKQGGA